MKLPPGFPQLSEPELIELTLTSDYDAVRSCEEAILDGIERHGYDDDFRFAIKLALEEALTNAIRHGHANDTQKSIQVRYRVDAQRVIIMVRDQGRGFDPESVPDPTLDENLERPCGRGVMLMRCYMTSIHYNDKGNEVWMLKDRADSGMP